MEPHILDKYEQRVVETYKNGSRYEGMVSNALKNGEGTYNMK